MPLCNRPQWLSDCEGLLALRNIPRTTHSQQKRRNQDKYSVPACNVQEQLPGVGSLNLTLQELRVDVARRQTVGRDPIAEGSRAALIVQCFSI